MRTLRLSLAGTAILVLLGTVGATAQEAGQATPLTADVILQGAPIHGANGLAIDQQGRLIVASVMGHELVALDPATGTVLERIGPYVAEVDVGGPDDVAVAPDGSICWTDTMGGFVDCLRADGSVDQQFVAEGVNPIAFLPDGRMFVAQAFAGDALYELDPALVDPPRLVMSGSGIAPWPDQLNGFDFGPDGLLYAPRPFSAQVGRIDVDAASPTFEVLAEGSVWGSVEFDSQGRLYASSPVTGEIALVDTETGEVTVIDTLGWSTDNMAFDAQDRLYASNGNDGSVMQVLPEARELSGPGCIMPAGIAAAGRMSDGADRLYVADFWSLPEINGASGAIESIDLNSHLGGTVTAPSSVAADGEDVIVTSWFSNVVQVWDPVNDVEIASWTDFAAPVNAIRFGEDLVVAELGTGSIIRQSPDGSRSAIAEGLQAPTGLVATDDDLWASDWATGIVWQIVTDGEPSMTEVASGLANPEGIAIEEDGSLLVVESGIGRLTRILPSGETVTLADGLPLGIPAPAGAPPAYVVNGVTVGESGSIYLTGDKASVVWRLVEHPAA